MPSMAFLRLAGGVVKDDLFDKHFEREWGRPRRSDFLCGHAARCVCFKQERALNVDVRRIAARACWLSNGGMRSGRMLEKIFVAARRLRGVC